MVLAIVVGVNAGIISAWFKHSFFDYAAMFIALIGVSMPIFWLGLMGAVAVLDRIRYFADNRPRRCKESSRVDHVYSYTGHAFARPV
ncbi:hypothetical protein BsIDN1_16130 [Bacillus safensis]|uniref:ABC transmembrane type-1 domain-containing protein n=1 Tax=Bacillus safensis TaxID=561879 RepID=A0A5S9M5B3_BACIA|nr:hypothetical protein BsIDN1_16130 [Bacillus safensis]